MTPHWKQWKPGPSTLHLPYHLFIQKYTSVLVYHVKRIQVEILSGDSIAQHKNCELVSKIAFKFSLLAA